MMGIRSEAIRTRIPRDSPSTSAPLPSASLCLLTAKVKLWPGSTVGPDVQRTRAPLTPYSIGVHMGRKLYVGNLSYEVDSAALDAMFAPHGTVDSADVIADRDTGRSKGFGFVEMSSDAEAQAAMTALNGQDSGGRPITVNEAKPKERRVGAGGAGARY